MNAGLTPDEQQAILKLAEEHATWKLTQSRRVERNEVSKRSFEERLAARRSAFLGFLAQCGKG